MFDFKDETVGKINQYPLKGRVVRRSDVTPYAGMFFDKCVFETSVNKVRGLTPYLKYKLV